MKEAPIQRPYQDMRHTSHECCARSKTASAAEQEAWTWLMERIRQYYARPAGNLRHSVQHSGQPRKQPPPAGGEASAGGGVLLPMRSELGRQIAVNFESDADFDKDRGRPRHGASFQPQ